jgi:hypothetical protein
MGFAKIVCSGSKADLTGPKLDFRFAPDSGLNSDIAACQTCQASGENLGEEGYEPLVLASKDIKTMGKQLDSSVH